MPDQPTGKPTTPTGKPKGTGRRSWHRRASRPVSLWMFALVIAVLAHPIIPQFRWLLVHMVTLGLVTTSIMIWGQHFTEALLKTRLGEESRPMQVRRIWALTGSIILTMIGMVASLPILAVLGAIGVSAMMLWYAFSLGGQIKAALAPRFAFIVRTYQIAACLLPVGATLGAILAFSPGEPWQGRLLLAHQIVNVLGFVGVTASATLLTLWPTILRTKLDGSNAERASRSLILMVVGVCAAVLGALVNNLLIGVVGIGLYFAGQLSILLLLGTLAFRAARQRRTEPLPLFPVLSVGAGVVWFAGCTIALGVLWVSSAGGADASPAASPLNFSITAARLQQLTIPFVVGFLLQLLLGAMSFLMPQSMGGGPRAVKASLAEMSRFAAFRVALVNLVLGLFAFSSIDSTLGRALFSALTLGIFGPSQFGSVTRVIVSLAAFVALAMFIVLLMRMVRVNVKERIEFQKRAALGMPNAGVGNSVGPAASNGAIHDGGKAAPMAGGSIGRGGAATSALPASSASASIPVGPPAAANPGTSTADPLGNASLATLYPGGTTNSTFATAPAAAGTEHGKNTHPSIDRRHLTGALAATGTMLGLSAIGRAIDGTIIQGVSQENGTGTGSQAAAPTGNTTRISVRMTKDMRFVPETITVPAGDHLIIDLTNADPANVHDLTLETGATSGRLEPGAHVSFDAGVISKNTEGWCSVVGHRAMGMVFHIHVSGTQSGVQVAAGQGGVGTELTRVSADLAAKPGASLPWRDPSVPAIAASPQNLTFTVTDHNLELAPGIAMQSMVYNGQIMGPILTSPLGGKINLTLINQSEMGHSIDFHAGTVAPNNYMRTIAKGESLSYPFSTDHAGIWLYHCSTMPMTVHLTSGMFGALIVPPAGLGHADREYVLVQSEHYLAPAPATNSAGAQLQGPDATAVHAVSTEKIFAERPDFTVFNGHANHYVHTPLEAKVGERVRIWVLAAGPSRGISFHVVGTIFDTVFKEGEYRLRPDNLTGGGAQALDLSSCQGGFVEMVFKEPGTYKAVNHQFVDAERGALAHINVTA